jgi:hypothetical protein
MKSSMRWVGALSTNVRRTLSLRIQYTIQYRLIAADEISSLCVCTSPTGTLLVCMDKAHYSWKLVVSNNQEYNSLTLIGAAAPLDGAIWWTCSTAPHHFIVKARDFEYCIETTVEFASSVVILVEVGADYCVGSILLETSPMVLSFRFRTISIFPILFFSF